MTTGPGDASHADRERVIAALRAAFVQGRLTKDELDLRVGQALASRAVAELTALTADLPAGLVKGQQWPKAAQVRARPLVSKVVTASACVILAAATLGMLAGIAVTLSSPAVFQSSATVVLPSSVRDISTQVFIATSDPVLVRALRTIGSGESPQTLRSAIQAKKVTTDIISISALGKTAAQAERTADAIANSYVAYINSPSRPGPQVQPRILAPAVRHTPSQTAKSLADPTGRGPRSKRKGCTGLRPHL